MGNQFQAVAVLAGVDLNLAGVQLGYNVDRAGRRRIYGDGPILRADLNAGVRSQRVMKFFPVLRSRIHGDAGQQNYHPRTAWEFAHASLRNGMRSRMLRLQDLGHGLMAPSAAWPCRRAWSSGRKPPLEPGGRLRHPAAALRTGERPRYRS